MFVSKLKVEVSFLSTQEISLVDFSNHVISSEDEILFATKISTVVETSNLSNLDHGLENNLENESEDEIFDDSNKLNTELLLSSTNLVASCSLDQKVLISKCDLLRCHSSKVLRSNQ